MQKGEITATRVVTIALCVGGTLVLLPLWVPLVLAAWFADVLQPAILALQHLFRGRRRGAAAVVVVLALAVLLPLIGVLLGVIAGALDLMQQLRGVLEGQGSLAATLLGGSPGQPPSIRDWANLVTKYGANAWNALTAVIQASATIAVGIFVFCIGLYTLALKGPRAAAWLVHHAPIRRDVCVRLVEAFRETGRGLLIGNGVTALAQGAVATIAYVVLGIPRALLLGPLTMMAALVPVFGTGLVWVPLAIGLAMTHEIPRALAVTAVGAGVLSVMDNFLRPVLTRYGKLRMPTYLVLISMLGGVAAFGGMGILMGPLLVRLAMEALEAAHAARLFR